MRATVCTYAFVMVVPEAGPGTSAAVVGNGTCWASVTVVVTAKRIAATVSAISAACFIVIFPLQRSLHRFEVPGLPALVDPGFQWPVEAQDHEIVLAGNRAHPIAALAGWRLRAKVENGRAV